MKKPANMLISLELGRAVAVLLIVAYHILMLGKLGYGAFSFDMTPFMPFLAGSMDLFFLISGFLMIHTTRKPYDRGIRDFLKKRLVRVYPAYWLVLIVHICLLVARPGGLTLSGLGGFALVQDILLLPHDMPPLLTVAWSLTLVVYFYLVYAATLHLSRGRQYFTVASFFVASYILGLVLQPESLTFQILTSPALLEIVAGMTLAMLWPVFPRNKYVPVACFVLAAAWFAAGMFPAKFALLSAGVPYLLVFIGLLSMDRNRVQLPARPILFVGGISYALYLVHVPALSIVPAIAIQMRLHVAMPMLLAPAVLLAVILAMLVHFGFEIPVQRKLRRMLGIHSRQPQDIPLQEIAR